MARIKFSKAEKLTFLALYKDGQLTLQQSLLLMLGRLEIQKEGIK